MTHEQLVEEIKRSFRRSIQSYEQGDYFNLLSACRAKYGDVALEDFLEHIEDFVTTTAQREKEELMYERGVVETEERIREGVEKLRVKKPLYDTHTSYNVAIEDVLSTLNK